MLCCYFQNLGKGMLRLAITGADSESVATVFPEFCVADPQGQTLYVRKKCYMFIQH